MLLLLASAMLLAVSIVVPVEVEALRTNRRLALLASVPRGGADLDAVGPEGSSADTDSKGGVEEEDVEDVENADEEDETEVEETVEEVEELVEEVAEAIEAEAEVEESAAEDSEADDEDAAEAEAIEVEVEVAAAAEVAAADEEEVEVDYPTEEIISDDVRYFHTTDGELADDEGMYTDGQNESPIMAVGVTRGGDGDGDASDDNEDDGQQAEEESRSTEATAVRTAASVAVIDDDLKEVLMTDLRYTEEDVSMMRPEIAKEVVYNKLSRPTEGMPKNWYIDPEDAVAKRSPSLLSQLAKKKGLLLSVAAVGVAAVVLRDNDAIGDTVEDMVDAVKSIPKSLAAIVVAAKNTATRSPKQKPAAPAPAPALEATPEEEQEPQEEEEETEPEAKNDMADFFSKGRKKRKPIKRHRTHSIKPGMTPKEVQDEAEADHTMLDKVLTGISKLVMKFFRMKI